MIKKLGLLAVAALIPYVGVAGQPTLIIPPDKNTYDVPLNIGKLSVEARLIARANLLSTDKATACSGLDKDYNARDVGTDRVALNLMVACGYDVTDRLKSDIISGDKRAVIFALETWNAYCTNPIFRSSDFKEFIVRYLVHADSISTWADDDDLRYYLTVRGVILSGGVEQLRHALASRPDYDRFDEFLLWYEKLEDFYNAVVAD
jgi:hypothetical protein